MSSFYIILYYSTSYLENFQIFHGQQNLPSELQDTVEKQQFEDMMVPTPSLNGIEGAKI